MPQIRLHIREADGALPPYCMCCGAFTTQIIPRNLEWTPPWVAWCILAGPLPYMIVKIVTTRRARLQAPLCDAHQFHWLQRSLLCVGSAILLGTLAFGLSWILIKLLDIQDVNLASFLCLAIAVFAFVLWLGTVIVVGNTGIRPIEITDSSIMLDGVSPAFIEFISLMDRLEEERPCKDPKLADQIQDYDSRSRNLDGPADAIKE